MIEADNTRNLEQEIQVGRQKVLEGHTHFVTSVFVKDNLIISGSDDNTIKIWDMTGICKERTGKAYSLIKTLKGHTWYVNSVFVKDNLIISGSRDKTIKIWDINNGEYLKTLECHTEGILSIFVKDNLIISGSWDNTIRITPISLFPCELTLFQSVINSYILAPHLEREVMDYFGAR